MHVIWLDLETTGLDPDVNCIVEIAAYSAPLTDPFNITMLIDTPIRTPGNLFDDCDPYVKNMHTKSGLIEACLSDGAMHWNDAKDLFVQKIAALASESPEKPTLAGSSIHFDKMFLEREIPMSVNLLSHRLFDVSAIKLEAESLGMPRIAKAEAHRAKDDIIESMRHLRIVRKWREDQIAEKHRREWFLP